MKPPYDRNTHLPPALRERLLNGGPAIQLAQKRTIRQAIEATEREVEDVRWMNVLGRRNQHVDAKARLKKLYKLLER
jgi:predicted DNA-binding protein